MVDFESTKYHTGVILRDNPELRTVDKREEVWNLVKKVMPLAKFSTVDRIIRNFQNTKKMYLPEKEDNRRDLENEYYDEFKRN